MASSYGYADSLSELLHQINKFHRNYIMEDKSPIKLKHLDFLRSYIKEFLSVVPHGQKFYFPLTAHILKRAVFEIKDFNPLKVASSWLAISTYASNILNQPWRKEYREIRLYSGYYKHHIHCCLPGIEEMFVLMGYERVPGDKMEFKHVTIQTQRMLAVSLDAIIAMVECQLMFSLYAEVSKYGACTWVNLHEYRESNIGSAEQCVKGILTYAGRSSQFCARCRREYFTASNYRAAVLPYCEHCEGRPSFRYQTTPMLSSSSLQKNRYQYGTNGYVAVASNKGASTSSDYTEDVVDKVSLSFEDLYKCKGGKNGETKAWLERNSSGRWGEMTDRGKRMEPRYKSEMYVDVCRGEGRIFTDKVAKSPLSEDGKYRREKESFPEKYPYGSVVNNNDDDDDDDESRRESTKRKPLGNQPDGPLHYRWQEVVAGKGGDNHGVSNTRWECAACTYHNLASKEVCEMCGKTKGLLNEIAPLVSGGKQCVKCTLVNDKNASCCEACGSSLQDSPTYI